MLFFELRKRFQKKKHFSHKDIRFFSIMLTKKGAKLCVYCA